MRLSASTPSPLGGISLQGKNVLITPGMPRVPLTAGVQALHGWTAPLLRVSRPLPCPWVSGSRRQPQGSIKGREDRGGVRGKGGWKFYSELPRDLDFPSGT